MSALSQRRLALLFAILMASGSVDRVAKPASAEESQIAVIASSQEAPPPIDGNALRDIYLKKIFLNPARRAYVPVNLPPADPLRNAFSIAVFHMNGSQLQAYWDRQYFQGVSPPYVLGSQTAVVKFVGTTPGAIGYVQPCYVTPNVRVILVLTLHESPPGATLEKCSPHSPPS